MDGFIVGNDGESKFLLCILFYIYILGLTFIIFSFIVYFSEVYGIYLDGYISLKSPEEIIRLKILRKWVVHIFKVKVVHVSPLETVHKKILFFFNSARHYLCFVPLNSSFLFISFHFVNQIIYLECGDKGRPNYFIFAGFVFTDDIYGVKISQVLCGFPSLFSDQVLMMCWSS